MNWTSVLAIYFLLWVMSAIFFLPFGIKTHDEMGIEKIPGQADSAPANFQPGRLVLRSTLLSIVLCSRVVAIYIYGWITVKDNDLYDWIARLSAG